VDGIESVTWKALKVNVRLFGLSGGGNEDRRNLRDHLFKGDKRL
jgi:hypothetical protein